MKALDFAKRWEQSRFSSLFVENTAKNTLFAEENALQFFFGSIISKKKYELTDDLIETYKKYTIVSSGDIIINGLNLNYDFVSQRIALVKEPGIITSAYIALRLRDTAKTNEHYYCYLFKAMDAQKLFHGMGTGIRLTLSFKDLKNVMLSVPPRSEQDQIVRFLDWKVSSINKLILIKRKQIALLHERQSVHISQIITHGLRDGVVTKNSGAEWLGDISEHWQAMRCKYLFSERDERSQDGSEQHLSMSQKLGLVPDSQLDERRILSESYVGGKLCYKDDLVLNRLKAHLGIFALAPQSGVISPDYTVLRPNTAIILPSFAETVLKSDRCRGELRIRVRGIIEGFWRLYTDDFNTIVLPVPPLDEQAEIMEYIVDLRNKTKKYEDTLTQEISSLQELKARLISDTVTGKIDARGIEIPEYEFVAEEANSDADDEDETEGQEEDYG